MQRKLFKNDEGLRAAISKKKLAILIFTHNARHWTWWRQPFWKAVSAILNSKMYKQIFKKNHSKWLKNVRIWVQFYAHFIYTKLFLMIIKKMCWNAKNTPKMMIDEKAPYWILNLLVVRFKFSVNRYFFLIFC